MLLPVSGVCWPGADWGLGACKPILKKNFCGAADAAVSGVKSGRSGIVTEFSQVSVLLSGKTHIIIVVL